MPNSPDARHAEPARRTAISRDGREFDPSDNRWKLNKDLILNLGLILPRLDPPLRAPYRAVMEHFARSYSAPYCSAIQMFLLAFLRTTGATSLDNTALLNYRAGLDRNSEYKLGYFRAFLARWYDQGYPGVTADTIKLLKSFRLRGNEKGAAVKSMDPELGPFGDLELQAFNEGAAQAFDRRDIDLRTLAFAQLLSHTGRRPGQLALLRIGDLSTVTTPDRGDVHIVRIPRSKQRAMTPRSESKDFAVTANLYRILRSQADAVLRRVQALVGTLPTDLAAKLPLFPAWRKLKATESIAHLTSQLLDDSLHPRVRDLTLAIQKIDVISPRTGNRLHVNPRRFRYTLGSRAAREGFGEYVIAELLDHTDTQNAVVYTRQHPNFRFKIDEAVGQALIPLAQAYAGTLVDGERHAVNGNDPTKRVGTFDGKVGTCGSHGFCGANPVACYTCIHFQPWVSAPHQKVLDRLLAERRRVLEITGDEAVASATDRSILAVTQVIAACEKRESEFSGAHHD